MTTSLRFQLCDTCLHGYRQLRPVSDSPCFLNLMPLGTLSWRDEHPRHWEVECCDDCVRSIVRLCAARTQLWKFHTIPPELHQLWADAHEQLPDWPGFLRLRLTDEELRMLDDVRHERDELVARMAQDFPDVSVGRTDSAIVEHTFVRSRLGVIGRLLRLLADRVAAMLRRQRG